MIQTLVCASRGVRTSQRIMKQHRTLRPVAVTTLQILGSAQVAILTGAAMALSFWKTE